MRGGRGWGRAGLGAGSGMEQGLPRAFCEHKFLPPHRGFYLAGNCRSYYHALAYVSTQCGVCVSRYDVNIPQDAKSFHIDFTNTSTIFAKTSL